MATETLTENTFSHSGDKQTFYWVSSSSSRMTSIASSPEAGPLRRPRLPGLLRLEMNSFLRPAARQSGRERWACDPWNLHAATPPPPSPPAPVSFIIGVQTANAQAPTVCRAIRWPAGNLRARVALERRALEAAASGVRVAGLPRRGARHAGLRAVQRAQGRPHRVPAGEARRRHAGPAGAPGPQAGRLGRPRLGRGPGLGLCRAAPGQVRRRQLHLGPVPRPRGRVGFPGLAVESRHLPGRSVPSRSMGLPSLPCRAARAQLQAAGGQRRQHDQGVLQALGPRKLRQARVHGKPAEAGRLVRPLAVGPGHAVRGLALQGRQAGLRPDGGRVRAQRVRGPQRLLPQPRHQRRVAEEGPQRRAPRVPRPVRRDQVRRGLRHGAVAAVGAHEGVLQRSHRGHPRVWPLGDAGEAPRAERGAGEVDCYEAAAVLPWWKGLAPVMISCSCLPGLHERLL